MAQKHRKNPVNDMVRFLATGFFVGYCPVAPGTAGTFVALLLYVILPTNPVFYWVFLLCLVVLGTLLSRKSEDIVGDDDPPPVVIDEICGYFVTMAFLPKTIPLMILGFIVFRLLDVFKLSSMRKLEKIKGGLGIMLDDIYAGMIGSLILHLIHWL